MLPISETPLSDLMAEHVRERSDASYARLLQGFEKSTVGVIGFGVPDGATGEVFSTAEHPLELGLGQLPTGEQPIIAYADPPVFAKKYGERFNATMSGTSLLNMVLADPKSDGIQLNSALTVISILLLREEIKAARTRWWKFW